MKGIKNNNVERHIVGRREKTEQSEEEEEEDWRQMESLISRESVGYKDGRCDH